MDILASISPVIRQARQVRLNSEKMGEFCERFQGLETGFRPPFSSVKLTPEDKLQLDMAYNTANFCYWGEPTWSITHQGTAVKGAYGMKAVFNRALEEGYPLLDATYLENLPEEDFAKMVRGEGDLPLFHERVKLLRQFGSILKRNYGGSVANVISAGEGDAIKLLEEVTENFPCYSDSASYAGQEVLFYKRAQLFVNNVHNTFEKQGKGLSRTEDLTALADYRVPQLLRNRGILEYIPSLAERVDGHKTIAAGSPEEVEIRAFTLHSVDLMVKLLRQQGFSDLKAIDLDRWLYLESKKTSPDDKPHHRVLTTDY